MRTHDAEPQSNIERLAAILDDHQVEYLIVGGIAEAIMGSPRLTYDIELCYRRTPDNITRLAAAIAPLNPALRGVPPGLPFKLDAPTITAGLNFTLTTKLGDIDLLGELEPVGGYEAVIPRAEEYEIGLLVIRTIALDDLIRIKEHTKRAKDAESLLQLKAIKQLRDRA